jgi:ubiquitin-conjugating enzyme E2 S
VGTPYEGGIFKCKLVIDAEFPQKPPKGWISLCFNGFIGYFITKIFHPNVAVPSGEICVNTLKKDWNPAQWSLSHIFEVIKCLLIVPFPESSLNEEAGR